MRFPGGPALAGLAALALAAPAAAVPLAERAVRTCSSLLVDAFARPPGTALGLNAYDKAWTDGGSMSEPPRIVALEGGGGALEFAPAGGHSWLLTDTACANMSRFDAIRLKLRGPASVYGIGALTGGCKSGEPAKQWYLPLQFIPTSETEPTEVAIPFADLFPGESSVNMQWFALQGFPPATRFRLHEVSMRGKPAGCEGESDVPSAGTWTSAPPARGSEDPGPVPALPTLRTGSRPYADLAPTYYLGACPDAAIALTFDDGPWRYTNDLLDILKQNDVKVTFFVNGENKGRISEHTNVLRRAVNEGHVIGSHTWSHRSLANLDEAGINDEMQRLAAAVHAAIGVYPTLMRPPFGAGWRDDRVRAALGRLGYHVVLYGIDSLDFLIAQGDRTVQETMDSYNEFFNAGQGGVITLAHDVVPSTVYTLAQRVIDLAKSKGYRFVTVDECVNHQDPKGWAPYSDTGCASDGSCEGL